MSEHVMLDLETLGTSNNAVILSIGACRFNPYDETPVTENDTIELFIDPESCTKAGMVIDPSTVLWWMHPERREAREYLLSPALVRIPLKEALERFSAWMEYPLQVWGNGATFDNVILESAYRAVGMKPPWPFYKSRCYRTMAAMALKVPLWREGTHHSAKWDAVTQANHLKKIVTSLHIGEDHV